MRLVSKGEVQINPETYEPTIDVTFRVPLITLQDLAVAGSIMSADEIALSVGRVFLEALKK